MALVTGGSSGLGLASAAALAREGADVAICARNAERLETARAAVDDAGAGDVLAVQADVTDDQGDIGDLLDETTSTLGGLDHLVVSGGGPRPAPFFGTNERDWYVAYDLLVMSVVRLVRQSRPHLAAGGPGSVAVVGCADAEAVAGGGALSGSVGRARVGLVRTLARELAPGVRVNAVLAGPHETPYLADVIDAGVERERFDSPEAGLAATARAVPLGRLGDPVELGDVVAFLASERAGYVTGAAIPVDGGFGRR